MNYKDYNDNELIYFISEKNEEATEIIYKKYKPLIVGMATKMYQGCKNSGIEINDLIQEGMLGLNQAVNNFSESREVTFFTFAKTCIERKMLTLVISTKRLKHKFLNESVSLDIKDKDGDYVSLEEFFGSNNNDPETVFIDNEIEEELITKIRENLTELEERVFMLKISNFNYVEIASLLDSTPKKIDNTLQRIKLKVKKILENKGEKIC